jgi:hypothetical protein
MSHIELSICNILGKKTKNGITMNFDFAASGRLHLLGASYRAFYSMMIR